MRKAIFGDPTRFQRHLPAATAIVIAACCIGAARAADPHEMEAFIAELMSRKPAAGEPYELEGNRLFFTNWYFIRPGNLNWLNDDGELVNTIEENAEHVTHGPWDAQLSRPSSPFGIDIVTQPAQRLGPVLKRVKPWERDSIIFRTVLKDGDKYRAWAKCIPGGECYLESDDGLEWKRPILRQREFNGSFENNLLEPGPDGSVFVDPSGPPEERYKSIRGPVISFEEFQAFTEKHSDKWDSQAVKGYWRSPQKFRALAGSVSPDGLHWKPLPEPFTVEHSDGVEVAYYDRRLKKYVVYTRNWLVGDRSPRWNGDPQIRTWLGEECGSGRRAIGRMESDTYGDFPLSENVIVPTPADVSPSEVFYTSIWSPPPGAPDHHLMFPAIWDTRDDSSSIGLWSSHDGKLWARVPGPRLLETTAFGQWDGGCIFSTPYLIELPNGDFALPYKGYNLPHKYPRGTMEVHSGYAVWPKGRIVAVEARDIGDFATVAILPPARTLRINAVTKRAGGVSVEVVRLVDQPKVRSYQPYEEIIPDRSFADCDVARGDLFWAPVSWRGTTDLGHYEGEGVILRFRLDRARLFGLEFK
ncbi:MAG TPA: hypothetical protein PKL84_05075 [Candidatus Hydrogenedentes bacterium]|nr:hypothetical protein [Candidatus Hydrogenedentota bacterium]